VTVIRQLNVISDHEVEVVALFKSAAPNDLRDIAARSTENWHSHPMRVALAGAAFAAAGKAASPDDLARVTGLSEEEIARALRMVESGRYRVEVKLGDNPNPSPQGSDRDRE
jgi:hypothetical protein